MQSARVAGIAQPNSDADVAEIVRLAQQRKHKVSVRGVGHSAGGHSFCENGVMIDMRQMNRILDLDASRKMVRVQSGAAWEVLTRALEPIGLAVTTKQEFDTFTIGGSVAANVHGKTVDYGPLIESIESLRLLKADGEIVTVSRASNAELFPLVIGGYGLFGVVLDVTLRLVDDRPIEKSEVVRMKLDPLCASYANRIRSGGAKPALCYGFLDAQCSQGFYVTYTYAGDDRKYTLTELKRDEPNKIVFDVGVKLQRWFRFTRRRSFDVLWAASAKPEVTLRSRRLLLWDHAPRAFQDMLLQKYFVPVENFPEFARRVGAVFRAHGDDLPLLTNHFRYVPGNAEALLSFAPRDRICMIPCYLARKDSAAWRRSLAQATDQLLNAALDLGGSYYLTFDILASPEQMRRAYPQSGQFFALKRKYDPIEIFSSCFYEKYAR
jgi:FAD/FMN-containing dehydrogenase